MFPASVRTTASLLLLGLSAWSSCHAGPAEDLAVFRSADEDTTRHGYVDAAGKVVIEEQYFRAYPFAANGLARVELVRDIGFIDARGEWVIPPGRFGRLGDFGEDGLAVAHVKVDENEYLGGAVTTPEYRAGFIDARGEWVLEPVFRDVSPFAANGLARAVDDRTGLTGFIGTDGKWRIAPKFPHAGEFGADGLAVAVRPGPLGEIFTAPMGYIDASGQFAIAPREGHAYPFAHGFARFTERGTNKTGYLDRTGAWVLEPVFGDGSGPFGPDGRAVVVLDDYRKPMLIDVHGARIALEGPVSTDFSAQGLAVAFAQGRGLGLIDGDGEWVLPPGFGSIGIAGEPPLFAPNGWLAVQHEGRPRLVNRDGEFATAFDAHVTERKAKRAAERAAELTRPPGLGSQIGFGGVMALSLFLVVLGPLMVLLVGVGLVVLVWRRLARPAVPGGSDKTPPA